MWLWNFLTMCYFHESEIVFTCFSCFQNKAWHIAGTQEMCWMNEWMNDYLNEPFPQILEVVNTNFDHFIIFKKSQVLPRALKIHMTLVVSLHLRKKHERVKPHNWGFKVGIFTLTFSLGCLRAKYQETGQTSVLFYSTVNFSELSKCIHWNFHLDSTTVSGMLP